jgi:hypothetical protein
MERKTESTLSEAGSFQASARPTSTGLLLAARVFGRAAIIRGWFLMSQAERVIQTCTAHFFIDNTWPAILALRDFMYIERRT